MLHRTFIIICLTNFSRPSLRIDLASEFQFVNTVVDILKGLTAREKQFLFSISLNCMITPICYRVFVSIENMTRIKDNAYCMRLRCVCVYERELAI